MHTYHTADDSSLETEGIGLNSRPRGEVTPRDAVRLVRETRPIAGWLSPGAIYVFAFVDSIQKQLGIAGNLFEIGVHHGKSALVLGAMAQPADCLGVCDIFGSQALNISASGKGDREIFTRNFSRAFPNAAFLRVYEKLSSALTPEEITSCRFMHVDGGHSSREALADLELCARCLAPGGIIAVDDAFHPTWPGVTDAIFQFMSNRPEMTPLVVGFNKMLLVHRDWRSQYTKFFDQPATYRRYIPKPPYSMKMVELRGLPSYVFHVHSSQSERSMGVWLHRLAIEHPALNNPITLGAWRGIQRVGRVTRLSR
jgi:hypothetical protein